MILSYTMAEKDQPEALDYSCAFAEINAFLKPDLVVMDGIYAFVDSGPMTGKRAKGNVFLASTDRIAIDAVGVAILKSLGSNDQIWLQFCNARSHLLAHFRILGNGGCTFVHLPHLNNLYVLHLLSHQLSYPAKVLVPIVFSIPA
jgi:hypothetical protein